MRKGSRGVDRKGERFLLLDWDGVLIDSFRRHLESVREYAGADILPGQYRAIHNGNFFQSNERGVLSGIDWRKYAEFVRTRFPKEKLSVGVIRSLRILSRSYRLYIVSSGQETVIEPILRRSGVRGLFDAVLGAEFHRSKEEKFRWIFRKCRTRARRCLFVTDTLGDLVEARRVGLPTLAVTFGYHGRAVLAKGKPGRVIRCFRHLLPAIRRHRWNR